MEIDFKELELYNPWVLLLALPALLLVIWSYRRRRGTPALLFPSVVRFRNMPRTWRQRAMVLIPLLQGVGLLLLIVAAARPRQGDSRTIIQSEGIAIQMVLDRSGSMEEEMRFEGKDQKRIDIVKVATDLTTSLENCLRIDVE